MLFVFGCVYIVKILFGLTYGELQWSGECSVCGCLWELCVGVHGNCVCVFIGTVCGCSWELCVGVQGNCVWVFMGTVCGCSWELCVGVHGNCV
jgi:hypothetical protein